MNDDDVSKAFDIRVDTQWWSFSEEDPNPDPGAILEDG